MAIAINDNTRQQIPFFSENQVLRAEDLNQLVKAVLGQLRQSRIFTIGLGIREGFEVRWDFDREALVVNNGYGVSSDGYGFELEECVFTHFRRPGAAFANVVPLAGNCVAYGDLLELIANQGFELAGDLDPLQLQQGWKRLGESREDIDPGNYCLLYLYREVSVEEPSCFNECESKGAEQAGSFHAVLVPAEAYARLFGPREETDNGVLIDLSQYDPRLPAFGRLENLVKLCEIDNWEAFYASYREACLAVIPALATAYGAVDLALNPDLDGPAAEAPLAKRIRELATDYLGKIYPENPARDCPDIQYLYAWLRELVLAFSALKEALNGQLLYLGGEQGDSGGLRCAFPGHLGLRSVVVYSSGRSAVGITDEAPANDPCRTAYLPAGGSSERQQLLARASALFARLEALVSSDNLLLPTLDREELAEIRITPDARRFPFLDGRALPFYYRPAVMGPWRANEQPNAAAFRYAAPDADHPLLFADTGWDFYRIEGHLGQPFSAREILSANDDVFSGESVPSVAVLASRQDFREVTMVERIAALRDCYNLAFDVAAVRVDAPDPQDRAPAIAGTDWENWYKNVRFDLLLWWGQLVRTEATQQLLPSLKELVPFLTSLERLSEVDDWEEFPFAICAPLPAKLTSPSLNAFVAAYLSFLRELEAALEESKTPSVWRFDPEMAECIREAAMAQRLYEEAIWRKTFFAGFAQEHPGLVHEGGVPKGGTFVIVYKGGFDRQGLIEILLRSGLKEEQLRDRTEEELRAIARRLEVNTDLFGQQTVVADFCLPYRCCGSGPVHLHLPPPLPPPPPLTLEVQHEPCYSREEVSNGFLLGVTVSEAEGTLSFIREDGTELPESFVLAAVNTNQTLTSLTDTDFPGGKMELTATYTKDSRSVTALLTVFQRPRILVPDGQPQLADPISDDSGRVRYNLDLTVVPAEAVVTLEVNGTAVDYDAAGQLLLVPRELVEGAFPLLVLAVNGECPADRTLVLPPVPDDVDPPPGDGDGGGGDDDGEVIVINSSLAFNELLNARRTQRQSELDALTATDATLADSEAFKRSFLYVVDAGPGVNPRKGLNQVLNALTSLAAADAEMATAARRIGETVATSFLDKMALIGEREDLTAARRKLVKKTTERLAAIGVNANSVFSAWKVSDLYGGLDRNRLTNIGKYLRE